jgi:hypothetical protein
VERRRNELCSTVHQEKSIAPERVMIRCPEAVVLIKENVLGVVKILNDEIHTTLMFIVLFVPEFRTARNEKVVDQNRGLRHFSGDPFNLEFQRPLKAISVGVKE